MRHKILWDFRRKTNRTFLTSKQKQKKNSQLVDFAFPVHYWIKVKESEKQYFDIARELKKSFELEGNSDSNYGTWKNTGKS